MPRPRGRGSWYGSVGYNPQRVATGLLAAHPADPDALLWRQALTDDATVPGFRCGAYFVPHPEVAARCLDAPEGARDLDIHECATESSARTYLRRAALIEWASGDDFHGLPVPYRIRESEVRSGDRRWLRRRLGARRVRGLRAKARSIDEADADLVRRCASTNVPLT